MNASSAHRRNQALNTLITAVAVIFAQCASACAGYVNVGGGNITAIPLYRSYVFGGISRAGNFSFQVSDSALYAFNSNVAQPPVTYLNTTVAADGATFHGIGQAVSSGFYAGRNYAQISVTNAQETAAYYQVAGVGSATSVRFFDANAAADHAVFTWHISGSSSTGGTGWADGRLDFGASFDPDVNWTHLYDDPNNELNSITQFGPGTYDYTLPIVDLGTTINLFYWSSAFTQVSPGDAAQGSDFTLTANYSNTFFLEKVELFDASNTPLSGWTLKDLNLNQDVFTADGRITPFAPAPPLSSPVPEPGTSTLLLIGLAGAGFARRRAKRSFQRDRAAV